MEEIPATPSFDEDTVEIILQLLPQDGHPEGRKVRNALIVNGKPLRVGSLRINALSAFLASLADQTPEQVLERLASYVAECQQQVSALQRHPAQAAMTSAQPIESHAASQPEIGALPSSLAPMTPVQPATEENEAERRGQEPARNEIVEEAPLQQLSLFS